MDSINARIRKIRKENALNQKSFAYMLGLTQTGISHTEQEGHNVSDITIKTICHVFNINENWLRNGIDPMYLKPESFSLDSYIKEKGASDLELEILKAYFEIDVEIRHVALEQFKNNLISSSGTPGDLYSDIPDTSEKLERLNHLDDTDSDDLSNTG